jgi:hypothetical protein
MNDNLDNKGYAHLPDDLLSKILEKVPLTVEKMNKMFEFQEEPIKKAISFLREKDMTKKISSSDYSKSLIAVDGGVILEKMTGTDLLLAVAAGVEGLSEDSNNNWKEDKNQYYQWQTVLPHGEANARLAQGVMFLMELSVLSGSDHEIRIMDGTHFTSILKINSMLSAKDENAGREYSDALKDFLKETYKKIIPDIPDIISSAFNNPSIIALAKYSSSTDINSAYLKDFEIVLDDKTFFTLALDENEYLIPLSVGQSEEEREKIWDNLHIVCNLDIEEKNDLNIELEKSIEAIKTKDTSGNKKESELYYTYYKPFQDGPAYRIEIKQDVAKNENILEKYLLGIKKQTIFPEIIEPYPQYLVDLMAKSVATGMFAIKDAIKLSPDLKLGEGKFNLLLGYRT